MSVNDKHQFYKISTKYRSSHAGKASTVQHGMLCLQALLEWTLCQIGHLCLPHVSAEQPGENPHAHISAASWIRIACKTILLLIQHPQEREDEKIQGLVCIFQVILWHLFPCWVQSGGELQPLLLPYKSDNTQTVNRVEEDEDHMHGDAIIKSIIL